MEEIVSLDKLSGLFPEDREARKSTISALDDSLEEVDKVKAELVALEKSLHARVEAQNRVTQQPSNTDAEGRDNMTLYLKGGSRPEAHTDKKPNGCVPRLADQHDVPPPSAEFWETLKCPLGLSPSEDGMCFYVSSRSLGLLPNKVELGLNPEASVLTVSGVHCPTEAEVAEMQTRLATYLAQAGLGDTDAKMLRKLYAKVAQGSYGRFFETIRLPKGVDETRISASCDEGVLCITLPKRKRRPQLRPRSAPLGSHPFLW
jgi:hypothetical protein